MATPTRTITWDNLNSSVGPLMDGTIKDGVFFKNLLLEKLNAKKKTAPGGKYLTEPIMNAEGDVKTYSGYDVITASEKEIVTTSQYEWANIVGTISIAHTDELQNAGPTVVYNLVEAKYKNMILTMQKTMTTQIFGTGVKATYGNDCIVGLQAAVATTVTSNPSAGAYGGITRDSTTATDYWKNQIKDMTSLATLDMLKLQNLWGLVSDGNRHPDIIVTTQAIYDKVWSLADARQRLGNEEAARLGYQSIDFNGVPLIVDKNAPAGLLYMLNTEFIYLVTHEAEDFKATPFMIPTDQMIRVKHCTWSGQLVSSNPRMQGVAYNLT